MVSSSTSSGPFIKKSTTPYSEIKPTTLNSLHVWGSPVRGVSNDRRMALQVINLCIFFLSFPLFCIYSKVFPMSSGIVIIIKDSETRQYTLLFAGCEKKFVVYSLFLVFAVGLWPLIATNRSTVTSHCLRARVARFDAPTTNSRSNIFFVG